MPDSGSDDGTAGAAVVAGVPRNTGVQLAGLKVLVGLARATSAADVTAKEPTAAVSAPSCSTSVLPSRNCVGEKG